METEVPVVMQKSSAVTHWLQWSSSSHLRISPRLWGETSLAHFPSVPAILYSLYTHTHTIWRTVIFLILMGPEARIKVITAIFHFTHAQPSCKCETTHSYKCISLSTESAIYFCGDLLSFSAWCPMQCIQMSPVPHCSGWGVTVADVAPAVSWVLSTLSTYQQGARRHSAC